jgi:hypothetical protein
LRGIALLLLALAVIFVAVNAPGVLAQDTGPDGPLDTARTASSASEGDGLTVVDVPLVQVGSGGDGYPQGMAPSGFQAEDPLALDNIEAAFSYYCLLGTAFNERTTTTTYAYGGNGCVYETGGTDNRFMAPLLIPDASVIKYLRLYYNDTNAGTDLTAWLTRYQPGITSEDLVSVTSTGSSGYGTSLSVEITNTVDVTNWAYTVIIAPNANANTNQFCGIRVAYYAPTIFAVALPVVQRNYP